MTTLSYVTKTFRWVFRICAVAGFVLALACAMFGPMLPFTPLLSWGIWRTQSLSLLFGGLIGMLVMTVLRHNLDLDFVDEVEHGITIKPNAFRDFTTHVYPIVGGIGDGKTSLLLNSIAFDAGAGLDARECAQALLTSDMEVVVEMPQAHRVCSWLASEAARGFQRRVRAGAINEKIIVMMEFSVKAPWFAPWRRTVGITHRVERVQRPNEWAYIA